MLSTVMQLLRSSLFVSLHLAGNSGVFPRPLSTAEEQKYLEQFAQGDIQARNKLVEHNMRLVVHIINKGYPSRKVFLGNSKTHDSLREANGHLVGKMESLKT